MSISVSAQSHVCQSVFTFCPNRFLFGVGGSSFCVKGYSLVFGVGYRDFDGEVLALLLSGEEGMTRSRTVEARLPSVSTSSTKKCPVDLFCLSLPMAILCKERSLTIMIIKIRNPHPKPMFLYNVHSYMTSPFEALIAASPYTKSGIHIRGPRSFTKPYLCIPT